MSDNSNNSSYNNALNFASKLVSEGVSNPHKAPNTFLKSTKLIKTDKYAGHEHGSPLHYFFYNVFTPGNLYHNESVHSDSSIEFTPCIMVMQFHTDAYHELNKHLASGEFINKDGDAEDEFKIITLTRQGVSEDKLNHSSEITFGGVKITGLFHNPMTGLLQATYTYKHYHVDSTGYDKDGTKLGHNHSKYNVNDQLVPKL